jgi:putative oxidoreductase
MTTLIRRIIKPYQLSFWYSDLTIAFIRITAGVLLAFYYGPINMGAPWDSSTFLKVWEVSPDFVSIVAGFGGIFSKNPVFFATSAALVEIIGGIMLILGLGVRVVSLLVFKIMLITLIYRSFDFSWSIVATISFLATGILGIWFGSGRLGLDYIICRALKCNHTI